MADTSLRPLRGWFPIEVLHFPWRSYAQCDRKAAVYRGAAGFYHGHRLAHGARAEGRMREHFESLVVDDEALARGLEGGELVEDTRLRDVLRVLAGTPEVASDDEGRSFSCRGATEPLALERPTVVEDVAFAVDAAVFAEAELVRAQRQLDGVEERVAALERGMLPRVTRAVLRRRRRGGAA